MESCRGGLDGSEQPTGVTNEHINGETCHHTAEKMSLETSNNDVQPTNIAYEEKQIHIPDHLQVLKYLKKIWLKKARGLCFKLSWDFGALILGGGTLHQPTVARIHWGMMRNSKGRNDTAGEDFVARPARGERGHGGGLWVSPLSALSPPGGTEDGAPPPKKREDTQ